MTTPVVYTDQTASAVGTSLNAANLNTAVVASTYLLTPGTAPSVPGSGLVLTYPAQTVTIQNNAGTAVTNLSIATGSITVVASKDTYVDLDTSGVLHYTGGNSVANGGSVPSQADNTIRLWKVVSGASNISAVTLLAPTNSVSNAMMPSAPTFTGGVIAAGFTTTGQTASPNAVTAINGLLTGSVKVGAGAFNVHTGLVGLFDGNITVRGDAGGNNWANQRILWGGDGSGYTLHFASINNSNTISADAMTLTDNGNVVIAGTLGVTAVTASGAVAAGTSSKAQLFAIASGGSWSSSNVASGVVINSASGGHSALQVNVTCTGTSAGRLFTLTTPVTTSANALAFITKAQTGQGNQFYIACTGASTFDISIENSVTAETFIINILIIDIA